MNQQQYNKKEIKKKNLQKTAKRVALIFLVGIILIVISTGIKGLYIKDRSIIVGVGIDYEVDSEEYVLTSEILTPSTGNGGEIGTFSKFFVTRAKTMGQAVLEIYKQTGNQPSLGQCQTILLGESLYTNENIKHCLSYFNTLESVIDSATLCCTKGNAHDLMQSKLPTDQSVSFTISQLVQGSGENTSVVNTNLNEFILNQITLGNAGVLNMVEYIPQESPANKQSEEDIVGSYSLSTLGAFKNFNFVVLLDEDQATAYTLLKSHSVGQSYVVKSMEVDKNESTMLTMVVNDKKENIRVNQTGNLDEEKFEVTLSINVGASALLRGYWGREGDFYPVLESAVKPEHLEQLQEQVTEQINSLVKLIKENNIDILNVYRTFEIKYGKEWQEKINDVNLDEMDYKIEFSAHEN